MLQENEGLGLLLAPIALSPISKACNMCGVKERDQTYELSPQLLPPSM